MNVAKDTLFTFLDRATVLTMPYFWSRPEIYAEVARRANQPPGYIASNAGRHAQEVRCIMIYHLKPCII